MLKVAIEAAKAAGDHAYSYFKNIPEIIKKTDKSPVTKADIEAEGIARDIIERSFPKHGIIGEESEEKGKKSDFTWIIDPIDGTRDFVRQLPYWCTLVAVLKGEMPIIGVVYLPYQKELYCAELGKGARLNNKKIFVSKEKNLEDAFLALSSAHHFLDHNKGEEYLKLCLEADMVRSISSLGIAMVFDGRCDAYVAGRGKIWDFAALAVLTEEAGGKWSDFEGNKNLKSNSLILSNSLIHSQILKILNSSLALK